MGASKKITLETNASHIKPDFHVEWGNSSERFSEQVICRASAAVVRNPEAKLRDKIGSIHTDTTHVSVNDVHFAETTDIDFAPYRVGFVVLISKSSNSLIDFGYNNDANQPIKVEMPVFMAPGIEIRARCTAGAFRAVACTFEPGYAEHILGPLDRLSSAQLLKMLDMRSAFINSVMFRLMNEALFPGAVSRTIADSLGLALLAECSHLLTMADSQQNHEGRLTAKHIQIIENYLSKLSSKAPSVTDLASVCGFSERYFAKIFKEQYGCSISKYLKSVQLSKAKTYLLETDFQLKEIAHRLGYSSLPNFSHSFREATGMTPGQFRKECLS
jgi:AraC-like DNA-binding protein